METLLRKYLWAIDLMVIAICAVFSARATATIIESSLVRAAPAAKRVARLAVPASQTTVYSKQVEEILNRNIFCSTCPPILAVAQAPTSGPVVPTLQKTSLPLKLLAVMYAPTAPSWSMAVIRDTDAKTAGAFAIGSKIREATVTEIEEARVYLDVGGRREYMDLLDNKAPPAAAAAAPAPVAAAAPSGDPLMAELDKGIKKTGEHSYEVQRGTVDSLLGNMSMLSRSARIVPEIRDGRAAGFRLFSVRPDGPFAKIGLQNGDVISAINGLEMTSPDKALEVYTKLKSAGHLSVGIERNGQKITKEYSIR
jgi:general secretion pathway protein C